MYFVYIIYSKQSDIFYRGHSENPSKRLEQHNNKESRYTSNKGPWELVFLESKKTKKEAIIREKSLKKYSKQQIRELILSAKNEL